MEESCQKVSSIVFLNTYHWAAGLWLIWTALERMLHLLGDTWETSRIASMLSANIAVHSLSSRNPAKQTFASSILLSPIDNPACDIWLTSLDIITHQGVATDELGVHMLKIGVTYQTSHPKLGKLQDQLQLLVQKK